MNCGERECRGRHALQPGTNSTSATALWGPAIRHLAVLLASVLPCSSWVAWGGFWVRRPPRAAVQSVDKDRPKGVGIRPTAFAHHQPASSKRLSLSPHRTAPHRTTPHRTSLPQHHPPPPPPQTPSHPTTTAPTLPHHTTPHRTAPPTLHRTVPHRTAPYCAALPRRPPRPWAADAHTACEKLDTEAFSTRASRSALMRSRSCDMQRGAWLYCPRAQPKTRVRDGRQTPAHPFCLSKPRAGSKNHGLSGECGLGKA